MKKKLLLTALITSMTMFAAQTPMNALLQNPKQTQEIITNNRPVARVNGKTISLVDVVKNMDLFLQMQYPQAFHDHVARYQYYQSNWKHHLNDMIDRELILADAEEKEVEIPEGEIRKEIDERFGPDVFVTLDKLNMTLEEAQEMIRDELIIRQMTWFKAYSGAFQSVTPNLIKTSIAAHLSSFTQKDEWTYQVITVRAQEDQVAQRIAKQAYALLNDEKLNPHDVAAKLNTESKEKELGVTVSASQDFKSDSSKVSKQHYDVLSTLEEGAVSAPVKQSTRQGGEVHRIFLVKEHTKTQPESFDSLVDSVKDQLEGAQANKARMQYVKQLRDKFLFDESEQLFISEKDDFQPFALI